MGVVVAFSETAVDAAEVAVAKAASFVDVLVEEEAAVVVGVAGVDM